MEFREPLPSDKVQLRERAQLMSPACCAMCGNGTCREGYVDPSVFYEYEGQVYFCWNCGLEIARALGCLPPDQTQFLINQSKEFAKELADLKEKYARAESRLAVYDSVIIAASSDDNTISDATEGSRNVETGSDEPAPSTDAGESEPSEPVKSPRRTNVKRTTVRNNITL